ncbi:hypothetical protein M9Y10_042762 [Tritrichomonas musculus]|uniref:Protein kinase domain-containing protein n=1 Tax=Tritrichomonas musculus TaxID=1915356 RepID=A0ABR2JXS3_9EUKA
MIGSIPEVNISGFTVLKTLGQGGFGRVLLVENPTTKEQYAAKEQLKLYDKDDPKQDFNKEIMTYSKVTSPALLKVYGYSLTNFMNQNFPVILTEHMKKSSLDKYFKEECAEYLSLTGPQKYIILLGITIAMKTLHAEGIIHRDLKPGNVLLDDNLYPHICDFGIAFISDLQASQIVMNTQTGTPLYQAPEVLSDEPYTSKIDVYSYSLIVYQLLTDQIPYQGYRSMFKMQSEIINGTRPNIDSISNIKIRNFLESTWSDDPSARPTFDEILEEVLTEDFQNFFKATDDQVNDYLNLFDEEDKLKISTSKLLSTFKSKASEGDSESLFRLAVMYDTGENGVKIDQSKAVNYYKQACDKDNSDAMLVYGHKLLKGDKIPIDKVEAANLYKKFADMGNMKAMNNYGLMLLTGNGIPPDKALAGSYLKRSADLGNPKAMLMYGRMLYDGNGIPQNKEEAAKYFKMSADQGNDTAMSLYAQMCRQGDGIEQDPNEAVKYFKIFASRGSAIAMFNYGTMLLFGAEIPPNKKEAAAMMKGAADQDDPDAMYLYGVMLMRGDGVAKNKKEAIRYLIGSADKGNQNAKALLNDTPK